MSIEECRNYDLVKETLLKYFGQDTPQYQTPPPMNFSNKNDWPQCERRERERVERAAQREKQKQELEALRLKQTRERQQREQRRRAREQEITFNNQCETLFAVYEAMEHPAVNRYTAAVDCDDSKIVDNVFDEMLCNDAMEVSVISDEIVTECLNEQICELLQCNDNNCDGSVDLGTPLMAEAEAAQVPAPLQTEIINLDNADGILQTGDYKSDRKTRVKCCNW